MANVTEIHTTPIATMVIRVGALHLCLVAMSVSAFCGSIRHDFPITDAIAFSARSEYNGVGALVWKKFPRTTKNRVICTGALIKSNVVLTAAHCLYDQNFIQINARDLTFVIDSVPDDQMHTPSKQSPVSKYTIHPNFARSPYGGPDLAVLEIAQPVNGTLYAVNNASVELSGDAIASFVGYGLRGNGQIGCYPYTQGVRMGGQNKLLSIGPSHDNPPIDHVIHDFYKPVDIPSHGMPANILEFAPCNGDSGGPVLRQINGIWTIIAVVESGYPNNNTSPYDFLLLESTGIYRAMGFATISRPFSNWIKSTAQGRCVALKNNSFGGSTRNPHKRLQRHKLQ